MFLFMERYYNHKTVLQLVELDIQRYYSFFRPVPLQKGYIPIIIHFNSFLHLGKILLYVFLIYAQYLILCSVYDSFFDLFHHEYSPVIAFCQYPIIKSGRNISCRHMTPYSVMITRSRLLSGSFLSTGHSELFLKKPLSACIQKDSRILVSGI